MSNTPLVNTSGRASAFARCAKVPGSAILDSKEIIGNRARHKLSQIRAGHELPTICTWHNFSVVDGGENLVAAGLLRRVEGAVGLVQDEGPVLRVRRHGGHARGDGERADLLALEVQAQLLERGADALGTVA